MSLPVHLDVKPPKNGNSDRLDELVSMLKFTHSAFKCRLLSIYILTETFFQYFLQFAISRELFFFPRARRILTRGRGGPDPCYS